MGLKLTHELAGWGIPVYGIESTFNHFGKNEIYEAQFIKYFRDKGMSKEEADKLWIIARAKRIIGIEVLHKKRPPKILGHVTVFTLKVKDRSQRS